MPKFLGKERREGREQHGERLEHTAGGALLLREFAHGNHECRHGGVVRERLDVFRHLLNQLVQRFEVFLGGRVRTHGEGVAFMVKVPCLFQETVTAVDAVGVPGLALVDRTEEHFVEAERVGAVFLDNHVGVDHVVHRLRHLFNRPAADVLAVFEHELGGGVFGTPSLEGFRVEHVVLHDVHVHVNRSHVVVLGEAFRHKRVRVLDAVHKIATPLNHALVDQLLERLFAHRNAEVEEELVPETGIDEVTRSMLRTAYVEVHAFPVFRCFGAYQSLAVARVHIAQVIGRGTGEARHRGKFEGEYRHVVDARVFRHRFAHRVPRPTRGVAEGWLAALGGQEFCYLGQFERQAVLGHELRAAVFIIYGERLAPIALAREDSVAQAVVHLDAPHTLFFDIFLSSRNGFLHRQAVEREAVGIYTLARRVHHDAFFRVETLFRHVCSLDERNDRQVEMAGKGIVARVVRRHCHDGPGAVARQHVVRHPHGNLFPRERIYGIRAGEHARHLAVGDALALRALLRGIEISLHLSTLRVRGHATHEFALGGEHHERHAENRVGAGGENRERIFGAVDAELHLRAFGTANPVALRLFDRVAPVHRFQPVEQTLCVGRNAQAPLHRLLLHHGEAAAHRNAVHHLVVGEHRAELRAPVYHCFAEIGDAVVHQHVVLLFLGLGFPLLSGEAKFFAAGGMQAR